ncbi:unnamed protein product [Cylicocyclus nassatus]|uniref:Uncharacterized protein n=1 Tax=Cylicocyclus nassatus TaxID=53992 RepID=A0AA36GDY4_CYLNA|nr:unnamed protein product [Cylicocyclus nassatus]
MFGNRIRSSLIPFLRRQAQSSNSVRMCYDVRNKISGAYNPVLKRDGPSIVKNGFPAFFTRPTFEEQIKAERTLNDTELGVIPTKLQRKLLILMRVYDTQADIPPYVPHGTMNRMHSRLRLFTIFLPVTFLMAFAFRYREKFH